MKRSPVKTHETAARPAKARDGGFARQYGIIVVCPDEAAQKAAYDGLRALGLAKLKPVAV